jgi:SAM-dependent methyltransferase
VIRRRRPAAQQIAPAPEFPSGSSVLDRYVRDPPSAQNAVDLFSGEWAASLPPHVGAVAGEIGLFDDPRVRWIVERAGGVDGRRVLELGPLEASHTWMLEAAGATVTAIEANSHAYLKSLIVKELLPLRHARFLLGDFLPFMEETDERFDLVLASGVLYHAPDPLRVLAALSRVADRVGIWTHYFHPMLIDGDGSAKRLFRAAPFAGSLAGVEVTMHRRDYREALDHSGFCGGPEESAVWMELDQLVSVLHALGFARVDVTDDDHDHPHGPCALLYAARE